MNMCGTAYCQRNLLSSLVSDNACRNGATFFYIYASALGQKLSTFRTCSSAITGMRDQHHLRIGSLGSRSCSLNVMYSLIGKPLLFHMLALVNIIIGVSLITRSIVGSLSSCTARCFVKGNRAGPLDIASYVWSWCFTVRSGTSNGRF